MQMCNTLVMQNTLQVWWGLSGSERARAHKHCTHSLSHTITLFRHLNVWDCWIKLRKAKSPTYIWCFIALSFFSVQSHSVCVCVSLLLLLLLLFLFCCAVCLFYRSPSFMLCCIYNWFLVNFVSFSFSSVARSQPVIHLKATMLLLYLLSSLSPRKWSLSLSLYLFLYLLSISVSLSHTAYVLSSSIIYMAVCVVFVRLFCSSFRCYRRSPSEQNTEQRPIPPTTTAEPGRNDNNNK